jgi:hypothetical protein
VHDIVFVPWWLGIKQNLSKNDQMLLDKRVILTRWSLWKQCNARVFGNHSLQFRAVRLGDQVKDELNSWLLAGVSGQKIVSRG